MFGKVQESGALTLGKPGTEFHPDLDARRADLVIVKPRVSAFYGISLDALVRARKVERLMVAGVSTVWAVQSTLRDAHDRDYRVFVLEEACAAATEAQHQASWNCSKRSPKRKKGRRTRKPMTAARREIRS